MRWRESVEYVVARGGMRSGSRGALDSFYLLALWYWTVGTPAVTEDRWRGGLRYVWSLSWKVAVVVAVVAISTRLPHPNRP